MAMPGTKVSPILSPAQLNWMRVAPRSQSAPNWMYASSFRPGGDMSSAKGFVELGTGEDDLSQGFFEKDSILGLKRSSRYLKLDTPEHGLVCKPLLAFVERPIANGLVNARVEPPVVPSEQGGIGQGAREMVGFFCVNGED